MGQEWDHPGEKVMDGPWDDEEEVWMALRTIGTGADEALAELVSAHRDTTRAELRREAASREIDAARTNLQARRTALRLAVRAARDAGATYPQIAAVLGVSVQRAHKLGDGPAEVSRR